MMFFKVGTETRGLLKAGNLKFSIFAVQLHGGCCIEKHTFTKLAALLHLTEYFRSRRSAAWVANANGIGTAR